LHSAAENLYADFIALKGSKTIEKTDFKALRSDSKAQINKAFKQYFKNEGEEDYVFEGGQIITAEVMKRYLDLILVVDKKLAPFEIEALEAHKGYRCEITIPADGEELKVGLKGIIDRIDKKNGVYRIIDYKTGSADKEFTSFDDLFSPEKEKLKTVVLQSFIYGLLFKAKMYPASPLVYPGIYDMRSMSQKKFSSDISQKKLPLNEDSYAALLPEFEEILGENLSTLFDKETPFTQTEHITKCKWCDYSEICGR